MNDIHRTEACFICLQIPQLDLTSLNSYLCVEIPNAQHNGDSKIEAITEETQITFMLTDISGHDFVS